jgi:hypothetical protein
MNETDRTSVGLLWHENIIDVIDKFDKKQSIPFYINQLENICFADYIDRITFQKQIWQFNEMSSLIKTFKNNKMYHEYFQKKQKYNPTEVRFTKVLTKYSTEYNNSLFIQKLCQKLGMDKKDLFGFFIDLKNNSDDNEIVNLLENYEIGKLDINRIYRYIEKYIKENATGTADKEVVAGPSHTRHAAAVAAECAQKRRRVCVPHLPAMLNQRLHIVFWEVIARPRALFKLNLKLCCSSPSTCCPC